MIYYTGYARKLQDKNEKVTIFIKYAQMYAPSATVFWKAPDKNTRIDPAKADRHGCMGTQIARYVLP